MKNVQRKLSAGLAGNDRQNLLLSVSLVTFVLYDEWIRTCLLQLPFYFYPFVIKMKVFKYWKRIIMYMSIFYLVVIYIVGYDIVKYESIFIVCDADDR